MADRYKLNDDLKILSTARRSGKKDPNLNGTSEETENELSPEPLLLEEVSGFLNWLLLFYLAAYFTSLLAKLKQGTWVLPYSIDVLSSPDLRSLLMSVFIWSIVLNLHLSTLKYQKGGLLLSLPFGLIVNWIVLQNI